MTNLDAKISLTFDKSSMDTFINNLEATAQKAADGAYNGIDYLTDLIYLRSVASCPVDTGALQSSAYEEIEMDGDEIKANVGYGGKYEQINMATGEFTDGYAVEVHEGEAISAHSRKLGACAHWHAKAFNSVKYSYEEILKYYISSALQGVSGAEFQAGLKEIYKQRNAAMVAKRAARKARLGKPFKRKSARSKWPTHNINKR
jgi:hypothetical protein